MTTFLIDLVLGFWLLLFGGMALLPIITGKSQRHQPSGSVEDRVISIAPARPSAMRPSGPRAPHLPSHDHDHRPAA